jgi:ABC-type lipoprotein release transport system permease subunit
MENAATEICIKSDDEGHLNGLKERISKTIGNEYEVFSYKELNASIFEISGMKRSVQFLLALVVVIIAAVGIVNTMLMAVMERITEIGTLKAMGFNNLYIAKMFLYEAGIIGVIGSFAGCIIGFLLSFHLSIYGLDLSRSFGNLDLNYPIKMFIKGEIQYHTIILVFIFGVCVSVFATLIPLRKAIKWEPVEALRYV